MSNDEILDVSVIVPFKDLSEMTITCVKSLSYLSKHVKEILLVSNNSSDDELDAVKTYAEKNPLVNVLVYNRPFNFQEINNWAAAQATGKFLFFLNNDVELLKDYPQLLEKMLNKASQGYVGAVGSVLLYEDKKTVQHAGVYLVPNGTADHLYIGRELRSVSRGIKDKSLPYDCMNDLPVSAVTAAAVVVETKKFTEANGFDERFIICGGDVDLCLRLQHLGYQSVVLGAHNGYMLHKESKSRSTIGIPYNDFVESYRSYITAFNINTGDPYLEWEKIRQL